MRTYAYGALAPTQNAELVSEQMFLAHRYKNKLIEIERARREKVDPVFKPHTEARAAWAKANPTLKLPKLVLPPKDDARVKAFTSEAYEASKQAQHESGVYWGTYLCIGDSVRRAAEDALKAPGRPLPGFQRFVESSQLVAVQTQGGLAVSDLLGSEDTQLRLVGEGRHRHLHFRIQSSDKGRAIWAVFPVIYHRALPEGASIKWARICRRRVGTKQVFSAQFVLDGVDEASRLPMPTADSVVGLDIGWRSFGDGSIRVSTWKDSTGQSGELRLPPRVRQRLQKVDDLRSIRDKNFNAAQEQLCAARRAQVEAQANATTAADAVAAWPAWLLEATQHAHAWMAPGKLAALLGTPNVLPRAAAPPRWRDHRFAGDEALFGALENWRKQDKHLLEWEANQRESVHRYRRELYRLFALQVARYAVVGVEEMDLREFAELPTKDEPKDEPVTKNARPKRFIAALSELRGCIKDAVARARGHYVELEPAYTTKTCAACGKVTAFDAAVELSHVCEHCGATWDQDDNAAENLLRAAGSWAASPARSQAEAGVQRKETRAALRRAKGLETRRARRSKPE